MPSSPPGSWPPPPEGWTPRPPRSDPDVWPAPAPPGPASPPPPAPDDTVSTTGATLSLAFGITAFVVSLVSMTIGTVLDLAVLHGAELYLVFILISLGGALVGIMAVVLAAVFRRQLRRRGSAVARGRALGGLIMGILAILSPLMGFLLGVTVSVASGH